MTTPRLDWWLIVRIGDVFHCWLVGDTSDENRTAELIDRARIAVGFPAGDDWILEEERRNAVQLTLGDPHPVLMAQATVHDLSALDRVTVPELEAYRAACENARDAALMQAARNMLRAMKPEQRAALYAEVPPPPRSTSTPGGKS